MPFLVLAIAAGLFMAWWTSFHEVACGCMTVRHTLPTPYVYASCYAYPVGCIAGAVVLRNLNRAGFLHASKRALVGLPLIGTVLSALFCAALVLESYAIAAALQAAANTVAVIIFAYLMSSLTALPKHQVMQVLGACGIGFLVFDNAVLPMLMHVQNGVFLTSLAQAALIACCAGCIAYLIRCDESKKTVRAIGIELADGERFAWALQLGAKAEGGADGGSPVKLRARADADAVSDGQSFVRESCFIPWRLAGHVVAYCLIFGMMHVEASSLLGEYYDRSPAYATGTLAALVFFWVVFMHRDSESSIWVKVRNVVFPLTMVGYLLLPQLNTINPYVAVAAINCAMVFYDFIIALAILRISRESYVSVAALVAPAMLLKSIGFLVGSIIAQAQLMVLPYDALQTPYVSVAIFLLLIAATFWVGDDRTAKKIWGMRVEMTPKKFAQEEMRRKCEHAVVSYQLTPRESEVLALLMEGKRPKAISDELVISINTVRLHVKGIYAKMGVHSREELEALIGGISANEGAKN
ncbi:transcriptional regulator NarL [Slackia heliotrinireducens]|uniref:helix-turn-helix transcriptional regulator n=1 Tax=Slackia heliotrinireducens TaxID=84110 RepID=UPI0001A36313|nr:helix-turn-helix transcriptional regulator [Slackia heliotrinireducens]VEH02521.1 transcriptional regulator NarL [Slackia heliotrinireducens]